MSPKNIGADLRPEATIFLCVLVILAITKSWWLGMMVLLSAMVGWAAGQSQTSVPGDWAVSHLFSDAPVPYGGRKWMWVLVAVALTFAACGSDNATAGDHRDIRARAHQRLLDPDAPCRPYGQLLKDEQEEVWCRHDHHMDLTWVPDGAESNYVVLATCRCEGT